MTELLTLAIGVGLVVALLFSEIFGLAAGGLVVPGYLAIYLDRPVDVLVTVIIGWLSYFMVQLISPFVILYGKRRTALMILMGYLLGVGFRIFLPADMFFLQEETRVVGYIIPGLLAVWMDRQGVMETLASLTTVTVIVRLLLILLIGEDVRL